MNAKLAADRFVNYWNARRDAFGPKFIERMPLAEALNDDILALEAGLFCLLPSRIRLAALLSAWIHLDIRAKDTLRRACSVPYGMF
jgi:hypothetical protein